MVKLVLERRELFLPRLSIRWLNGTNGRFTMEALEHAIARDLFPAADFFATKFYSSSSSDEADADPPKVLKGTDVFEFHVNFLELLGKNARDLVGVPLPKDGEAEDEAEVEREFKIVDIVEDKVHPYFPTVFLITDPLIGRLCPAPSNNHDCHQFFRAQRAHHFLPRS
jgi:hypothetical protein